MAFGSYRVLEAIGAGRFGPVYRAQDQTSGALVAVKIFDQGLTLEQCAALAAALERLAGQPLNHASIVPPIHAGVSADQAWLAEPWAEATPLDYVMQADATQPLAATLLRITQVAGALDFAAAAGIHHGALHPRDILVSADETFVTGIGVLESLADAGLEVPMEGAYVSPQRALGLPLTARDDIYSLAAITFELLTGRLVPEQPAGFRAALAKVPGVDHAKLADVLEGSLSKEPGDRPSTALEFAAALQYTLRADAPPAAAAAPAEEVAAPPVEPAVSDLVIDQALARPSFSEGREIAPEPPVAAADLPLRANEPEMNESPMSAPTPEPPVRRFEFEGVAEPRVTPPSELFAARPEPAARSHWLPVTAALAIGVLTGFASGFVVGQRDNTPMARSAAQAVRQPQPNQEERPASTAGQGFTESNLPAQTVTDQPVIPPPEPRDTAGQAPAAAPAGTPRAPSDRATDTGDGRGRGESVERSEAMGAVGPGTLQVDSRPRGARVFVDGRLVGTTPLSVPDVSPGVRAVRIDLNGYQRWVASVNVAPGSRQRVAASLER